LQWVIVGIALSWFSIIFTNERVIYSFVKLFVLYIGYFGIKQTGIFMNVIAQERVLDMSITQKEQLDDGVVAPADSGINEMIKTKKRYSKSGLTEELSKILLVELNDLMTKNELYKIQSQI
jgi:hypothetical protein